MAANPNTFGGIPEAWDDVYQVIHYKQPVFRALVDERLATKLRVGDTIHRSYASNLVVNTMAGDGGYTTQAVTDTDETLVINQEKEVSIYVKELDELQNSLPVRLKYARQAMNRLFLQIDGDILGNYDQATYDVDDLTINSGGTADAGITVDETNIDQVFIKAMQRLVLSNVIFDPNARFTGDVKRDRGISMPIAVISAQMYSSLLRFLGGKDSMLGDRVSTNGNAGMFMGFNVFVSNALGWSASLAFATIPTAGDTITINGVVLTAAANGAASAAGDFSISTTNDLAGANLVLLINGTGTAGASTYIDLSTANRNLLKNITATYSASGDALTLKATGYGSVAVSETLTPAADIWTLNLQIQHAIFGVSGCMSLVIQKTPNLKIKDVSGKVGNDIVSWAVYGHKVFTDQKVMFVDVKVRTDAY